LDPIIVQTAQYYEYTHRYAWMRGRELIFLYICAIVCLESAYDLTSMCLLAAAWWLPGQRVKMGRLLCGAVSDTPALCPSRWVGTMAKQTMHHHVESRGYIAGGIESRKRKLEKDTPFDPK